MRRKRKGFTLVELLVVIAIIAMLMGILMPALAKVRAIAYRVVCGTNLSGIGKAMLIYANDYEDELPQAGGVGTQWVGQLGDPRWRAANRFQAYSLNTDGSGGQTTVASSLYLLVKYTEVGPKQFVCRGTDTTEWKIPPGTPIAGRSELCDLIDGWDFGPNPTGYCSYSYHAAYNSNFALTTASSQPGMAVAADRNPWLDPAAYIQDLTQFVPDVAPWNGSSEQAKAGNALAHGGDGQNVLFLDSHVAHEKRAFCGVQDDNIYTRWTVAAQPQLGEPPLDGGAIPAHKEDSLLVNEGKPGDDGTKPTPPPDPVPDPDIPY
jgi:prepilin-type N-terminal cleavage/methylation domain-containing protein